MIKPLGTYRPGPGLMCAAIVLLMAAAAVAGEADVEAVRIVKQRSEIYRFDVTVRHADTGWRHYADRWDIVGPDGRVLGVRKLLHPHENEQPFTRSLSGVAIPAGIARVTVRAHGNIDGLGGKEITVEVPR